MSINKQRSFGIDVIYLCSTNQSADSGSALDQQVVDLQPPVVTVARERFPQVQRIEPDAAWVR
ncbi:hypothetical protein [Burkholderia sp. Ac-20353]|uniref:hypothetical protein n=1 Tax=Burkholderia sp. Ac-20353 TaxID=2703894 RepID=UPI00197BAE7E|nr:hypothetical protein [Burkholderia sp. Ac-20353]MBN3788607.1 hypothetical protein [Burkholderia sp. Ac-20353]